MKNHRAAIVVALALALSFPLASCGSSSGDYYAQSESKEYYDTDAYAPSAMTEEYYAADDEAYAAGSYEAAAVPEPMPEEEQGLTSGTTANTTDTGATPATESQKLVYTANVSIDTTEYDTTVAGLRDLMTACGAFAEFENEYTRGYEELHVIQFTLRVPADKYNELMTGINGIGGTVTNRTSQVTNITRTYADNEAVIEGLEIQEQRLLDMMSQAETVEDMILVEERLSEVQTQLNRARTSRESMDASVNLSTVSVTINEVRYETATGQTSYFTRVVTAFADMWDGFVEGVGDFIIGLIYAIPAIVILVLFVVLITKGTRRLLRKRAAKKEAAAQAGTVPPQPVDQPSDGNDAK